MSEAKSTTENGESVPLAAVVAFLKHHLHDVRNDLNALNLEAMLLDVYVTDREGTESVQRIQDLLHQSAGRLGALSRKFSEAAPSADTLSAQFVLTSWRDEWNSGGAAPQITWETSSVQANVKADPVHLTEIFREWLSNAKQYGSVSAIITLTPGDSGELVFRLTEPKSEPVDTAAWGLQPFARPRRGSYGLGIWRVQTLVKANGGTWKQYYAPAEGCLVSELRLPVAQA
jgi:light-regulated signal transduction histidine kinase (bacteriophytochrome)